MSKLVSKMNGINVEVGQAITEDEELVVVEAMNMGNAALRQMDEYEDKRLYEYCTSSYSAI